MSPGKRISAVGPRIVFALAAILLLIPPPFYMTVTPRAGNEPHRMSKTPKRVLVVSLDGLDARYLERREEYGLRVPTLRRLMSEGAWSLRVKSVYPSVTYPTHTTLVTGALPARHGIYGNELFEPPGTRQTGDWHWFARDIRAETLWDAAAREGLKTCLISWPVGGGAGDYNVPEILKPSAPLLETLALMKENARPRGLIEEVERHDPRLYGRSNREEQDDLRTRFAEYVIETKRPEVVMVHLFDFDHAQHVFGPFSREAFAILEKEDEYVARLVHACERAGTLSETAVFVVSDHGFRPISKLFHPGVPLARAGLMGAPNNAQGQKNDGWRAFAYVNSSSCAIIMRDRGDAETLRKLRAIFKPLEGREGSGVARVLEREEVRALGANPDAALVLEAADGFSFGFNLSGESVTPSVQRGQHGYLPTRPDYLTSFIASGAGIARRGDLGPLRLQDIGPTIAHTLGLNLRDAQGRRIKVQSDE